MFEKYQLQLSFVFFVILCFSSPLTSSLKHKYDYKNGKCTKISDCKCVFENGDTYDISDLTGQHFGWVNLTDNYDLFYTPCKDYMVVDSRAERNDCDLGSGVTMCLRNNATNMYFSYGHPSDGDFISTNIFETVSLQFQSDGKLKKRVRINFKCDRTETGPKLRFLPDSISDDFVLELISPESCLKSALFINDDDEGMSTGSRLILMFLFLSLVYFGGGVLALKFIRGAEGKEMIPNYEFWADLPYLVRDGILFTLSGCQASPSYDRI